MLRSAGLKSIALDLLAGLIAFSFVIAWLVLSRTNDLQSFTLVTAVLFFLAGTLRGAAAPRNAVSMALLIGLGGIVPVVLMRVTRTAFTEYGYVPLFVTFSLLLAAAGLGMRRLLVRGRTWPASLLALVSLGGATLVIMTTIPLLIASWSNKAINLPAPPFSFATPDGKTVTSVDLRGRVVVLAFWATWCTPCQQELPDLQKAFERYKDSRNTVFYAVGGPWGGDTMRKESAFAARISVTLPLAFDSHGAAKAFGVQGFPALVILDGEGRVRLFHDGYDASEHLASEVAKEVGALQTGRT